MRAARAGLRFVSTGKITAHKFAAGHRYLSYLRPDCEEQRDMLRTLRVSPQPDFDSIIQTAKRIGRFMTTGYAEFTSTEPGFNFQRNRQNKGINRPPLRPLRQATVIEPTDDLRALDWYQLEAGNRPHRWSGPNPRSKILIPFTGARARIGIEVIGMRPGAGLDGVSLFAEGQKVGIRLEIFRASA